MAKNNIVFICHNGNIEIQIGALHLLEIDGIVATPDQATNTFNVEFEIKDNVEDGFKSIARIRLTDEEFKNIRFLDFPDKSKGK
jgi:hypothetical protein